jgi:hypothetical protein
VERLDRYARPCLAADERPDIGIRAVEEVLAATVVTALAALLIAPEPGGDQVAAVDDDGFPVHGGNGSGMRSRLVSRPQGGPGSAQGPARESHHLGRIAVVVRQDDKVAQFEELVRAYGEDDDGFELAELS